MYIYINVLLFLLNCLLRLLAVSGNTAYACQFAKMLLRQSTVQVILATWVAAVAGLAAWYLM